MTLYDHGYRARLAGCYRVLCDAFAGSKDAPRAAPPPVENGEAVQAGP